MLDFANPPPHQAAMFSKIFVSQIVTSIAKLVSLYKFHKIVFLQFACTIEHSDNVETNIKASGKTNFSHRSFVFWKEDAPWWHFTSSYMQPSSAAETITFEGNRGWSASYFAFLQVQITELTVSFLESCFHYFPDTACVNPKNLHMTDCFCKTWKEQRVLVLANTTWRWHMDDVCKECSDHAEMKDNSTIPNIGMSASMNNLWKNFYHETIQLRGQPIEVCMTRRLKLDLRRGAGKTKARRKLAL